MSDPLVALTAERRASDQNITVVLNRLDMLIIDFRELKETVKAIDRRVTVLENYHSNVRKDVDNHDIDIKEFNKFMQAMTIFNATLKDHIETQKVSNQKFSESIEKTTKFQNNLLMIGGVAFLLWQTFGVKLISAVEVLVK